VEAWGKGMTTLRYDYEVRDESEFFKGIPSPRIAKEMVDLASHILDKKAGRFDTAQFKDEYELALRKLDKRKASGKTIEPPEEREDRGNVVDLMEALRQSVKGKGRKVAALRTGSDSKKTATPSRKRKKAATPRARKRKAA
jgi:DNA end-binding protein Ku